EVVAREARAELGGLVDVEGDHSPGGVDAEVPAPGLLVARARLHLGLAVGEHVGERAPLLLALARGVALEWGVETDEALGGLVVLGGVDGDRLAEAAAAVGLRSVAVRGGRRLLAHASASSVCWGFGSTSSVAVG